MKRQTIVSRDEWITARRRLLVKEKEFNRQRDALSAERRKLPTEEIKGTDFNYDFQMTLDESYTEYNYAPVSAQPEGRPQEGEREG